MGRVYFNREFYKEDSSRQKNKTGSVFVIGPEASGTQWVASFLGNHEDIHCVHHLSYPSGSGIGEEGRHWPDICKFDPSGLSSVIVVCRDVNITQVSQRNMGYAKTVQSWTSETEFENFSYDEESIMQQATDYITEQLARWKGKFAMLSYESMIQRPTLQLSQVFRLLNYDVNKFDYNTVKPIDGNKKYVKMENE
jgi:hypothetical protein